MEALQVEEAKALGNAVEDVYSAVSEISHVVGRAPREFIAGRLDRTFRNDEGLRSAWARSQDGDKTQLNSYIGRIAKDMEENIDRLHGETVEDISGSTDENVRNVVAYVREKAGLPEHFPAALVEDFLENACNSDPNPSDISERARNPLALQEMLNNAGRDLRAAANRLISTTKPEPEKPWNLTTADMGDLDDKSWQKVKTEVARRSELAQKRR
jgi:hypothetical protein